jgi:hypothetical protein
MIATRVRKSSFAKDNFRGSVFDTDAGGAAMKQGYLSKLSSGALSKRWQKRFFRLEGHYLKYFENEETDQKNVKGVVDLKDVSSVEQLGGEIIIKMRVNAIEQKV